MFLNECKGGGTGFIGRNLKKFLLRENYEVTVISRVKTGEKHIMNWVILCYFLVTNCIFFN